MYLRKNADKMTEKCRQNADNLPTNCGFLASKVKENKVKENKVNQSNIVINDMDDLRIKLRGQI
jgi:acetamidase/formamidase